MAASMLVFLVPTTWANPACTASGLSVDNLVTRTCFLIGGAVASSWIPPESVMMSWAFFMRMRKSKYPRGGRIWTFLELEILVHRFCWFRRFRVLGWIG